MGDYGTGFRMATKSLAVPGIADGGRGAAPRDSLWPCAGRHLSVRDSCGSCLHDDGGAAKEERRRRIDSQWRIVMLLGPDTVVDSLPSCSVHVGALGDVGFAPDLLCWI